MMQPLGQWLLEPGNQQLLIGIIIALGIGVFIGTWIRGMNKEKAKPILSKGDEAFFKGIQYMLSDDQDHAIEEFTKSVQVNSETIETYVALGNLYRSKGDIDRAIRIRQNIILRPTLDEHLKLRALFDLGMDYLKGGFLNRALKTFNSVIQKNPSDMQSLEMIEKIYVEMKEWEKAYDTRQKIGRLTKMSHHHILSHYLAEAAKLFYQNGDSSKAISYFNKAISTHKACVDAYLHLGDIYFDRGDFKKAISIWKKVTKVAPQFTFLAYRRLEGAYSKMKNLKPIEDFLKECTQSNTDAFTHMALARFLYNADDIEGALNELKQALTLDPSFWEARKFKAEILLGQGRDKDALADYEEVFEHLNISYLRFQCKQCGFEPNELQWQCPQCKKWDTIQLRDASKFLSNSTQQSGEAVPQLPGSNREE